MAVMITTWHRLEPVPRTDDLAPGLAAALADPLWLLGRQWQFNEFEGEDAGSPVDAVFETTATALTRFRPGPTTGVPEGDLVDETVPLDLAAGPLEAAVERVPIGAGRGAAALGVAAGRHAIRLFRAAGAADQVPVLLDAFAIGTADIDTGSTDEAATSPNAAAVAAWARSVVGRVPDGRRLAATLRAHEPAGALTDLPATPTFDDAQTDAVLEACNHFLVWFENGIGAMLDATATTSWQPRRLEYGFAAQAATEADDAVTLEADSYTGGDLDWFHVDARRDAVLGVPPHPTPARHITRHLLPSRVFYGGMPAERFWEFEDARVSFGGLAAGKADLARMLLAEFALSFGNDWFVIPVELPVGSVCDVSRFVVRDTFGVETSIPRSRSDGWSMFELTDAATEQPSGLFVLPPTLTARLRSEPIEEVGLARDEMANMVWAIERTVTGDSGAALDQYREAQVARSLALGASQQVTGGVDDADLVYRLASYVPENWHPLVPVPVDATRPGVVQLELRGIRRVAPDGTVRVAAPRSSILQAADPLVVEEEEVDRSGRRVRRQWELCRWLDGRYWLWNSFTTDSGPGEAASGLAFDTSHAPPSS